MHIDSGNMILSNDRFFKGAEKEIVPVGDMSDLDKNIIQFLKDNPNPSDEGKGSVHEWAEKNNYDKHDVEEAIYKLMSVFVKFLTNGRANEKGVTEKDVDPEELKMGIEIEYEHTTDMATAKRIVLDHLAETKNTKSKYYTYLKEIEKRIEDEDKMAKK